MNKRKNILCITLMITTLLFNSSIIIKNNNCIAYAQIFPVGLTGNIEQTQIINGVPIKVGVNYIYTYNNFLKNISAITSVTKTITDIRYYGSLVEFHSFNGNMITVSVSGLIYEKDSKNPKNIYGVFNFYV